MTDFNLETIEDIKAAKMSEALTAMSGVLNDEKATIENKIEAAKVICVVSELIIKEKHHRDHEKSGREGTKLANKLVDQLKDLTDED